MSSTAIAISTSQSSVAIAAANRARRVACEGLVGNYDPKGASIELMREYADCIDLLYPDPLTPIEAQWIKYVLIACFIGGGLGSWYMAREGFGDWYDYPVGFVFGFLGTGAVLGILGLLLMALGFVLGVV